MKRMDRVRWSRCIDVSCLPEDVVGLIEALGSGEDVVIVRGDEPIAAISALPTSAVPAGAGPTGPTGPTGPVSAVGTEEAAASVGYDRVTVVASALHMSGDVRSMLGSSLGEDYVLLDFGSAPPTADVLLVPPGIGLTLLANLRGRFPRARVMVVEASDDSLGMSSNGPVRRLMDAGVETYLVTPTIPALAAQRAGIGTRLAIDASGLPIP